MMKPSSAVRIRQLYDRLGLLPMSVLQLMARGSIFIVFWRSGQAKRANWDLAIQLFTNEYKVPVLPPDIAAYTAGSFELTCSVLILLGLFTRVATLPLIGMTLVIQLFVYPQSWPEHLAWMTFLLLLLSRGPGVISLDYLIGKYFARR